MKEIEITISKSSAKRVVDICWPIGNDVIYGVSLSKVNTLDNSQLEILIGEISEGINYLNKEREECKMSEFFRKRRIKKSIEELEEWCSLLTNKISKGYHVSRLSGIV